MSDGDQRELLARRRVGDALRNAVKLAGGNALVAEQSGVPLRTLNGYIAATSDPKVTNLMRIAEVCGVSLDELVGLRPVASERETGTVPVQKLAFSASAGAGTLVAEEKGDFVRFPAPILRRLALPAEHARVLEAEGDSMAPTIEDGELMLIDRRVREAIDNKIFVFSVGEEIFVKRLRRVPGAGWQIVSDNPEVPAVAVPRDAPFRIYGRVRWTERAL